MGWHQYSGKRHGWSRPHAVVRLVIVLCIGSDAEFIGGLVQGMVENERHMFKQGRLVAFEVKRIAGFGLDDLATVSFWQPMASMVTIFPASDRGLAKISGMIGAVLISLVLLPTFFRQCALNHWVRWP
jgi:hypothetical protein